MMQHEANTEKSSVEINRFICVLLIYSFEMLVAKVRLFRSGQVL
jgi:hypothetical protein